MPAPRDVRQLVTDVRCTSGEAVDEVFLRDIGYLAAEPMPFRIGTRNVDQAIAAMAG